MFFIHFLFFSFYLIICQEDDNFNFFQELKFPKSISLVNGYIVVLASSGIFSFYPNLDNKVNSYVFQTDEIPENIKNSISNADFTQFDDIEDNQKYVLCAFYQFIYVISEEGEVLFKQTIGENINSANYPLTLTAYNYMNPQLFFLLGYNNKNDNYQAFIYLSSINLSNKIISSNKLELKDCYIFSENISCNIMKSNNNKIFTCFSGDTNYNLAVFQLNSRYNRFDCAESDISHHVENGVRYVFSNTNRDKTKALVCYIAYYPLGRCLYYNAITNQFSDKLLEFNYCHNILYGINSYFFKKPNEFIFSCIDGASNFFLTIISENFDNNEEIYKLKKFSGCENLSLFSIAFVSNNKSYYLMANAKCNSEQEFINIFMLTSRQIEDDDEIIKGTETIITSKISESLYYTQKETDKLTQSEIISKNTVSEGTDTIEYPNDSPCKEIGTIEKEGKCICDESKGYYSVNSKLSESKCYQKNEIPKNLYYNNITKSYELCYKTCGTCEKGGSSSENNCQSCATNYIPEPENRTSNCVESCKYKYYYDSLNQYSCTEDEQCPLNYKNEK